MAQKPDIPNYTAADIEKYHRGELNSKQKHDLEKAALDDPFLADALEGYALAKAPVSAELNELRDRLGARIDSTNEKATPVHKMRFPPWLRAAAMVLLLATAGLLVYQFAFNKKDHELAETRETGVEKKQAGPADSITAPASESATPLDVPVTQGNIRDEKKPAEPTEGKAAATSTNPPDNADDKVKNIETGDEITTVVTETKRDQAKEATVNPAPPRPVVSASVEQPAPSGAANKDMRKEQEKARAVVAKKQQADSQVTEETGYSSADNNNYRNLALNTFRGRVTDPGQEGLPFVNLSNRGENLSTYTDARGYFEFRSPDSVLQVDVRSLGYRPGQVQLRNNVSDNQVTLFEDTRKISQEVLANQKPNVTNRALNKNINAGEPEPLDGWDKYDSYLSNNLNIPSDYKSGRYDSHHVNISFTVDKSGRPVSFKVEKSLCSSCDKEAIRLIREGPAWKRGNDKKARTTLTVTF